MVDNDHLHNDLIFPWTESKAKQEIRKKIFERAKKNRDKMKKEMIRSIKIDEETSNEYLCYNYKDYKLEQLIDTPTNRQIYDELINEIYDEEIIKNNDVYFDNDVKPIKKMYKFYFQNEFIGLSGIRACDYRYSIRVKNKFQNTGLAKLAIDFTISSLDLKDFLANVVKSFDVVERRMDFFNTIFKTAIVDNNIYNNSSVLHKYYV